MMRIPRLDHEAERTVGKLLPQGGLSDIIYKKGAGSIPLFFIILGVILLTLSTRHAESKKVDSYWAQAGRNFPDRRHELPFLSRRSLMEIIQSGQKVTFLDVRQREEFETEHLPKAKHIEGAKIAEDARRFLEPDEILIPYCQRDFRAFSAAEKLKELGFPYVFLMMPRGLKGWKADGLPTAGMVHGKDEEAPWRKLLEWSPERFPREGEPRVKVDFARLPAGAVRKFLIRARRFQFKPDRMEVNWGDRVILRVKSFEGHHGIAFPDFAVIEEIPEGREVTVEFIADKRGRFSFGCSVYCGCGHNRMHGELVVR